MKDKIVSTLIKKEIVRQQETLDLIPSENSVSEDVLTALGSPLVNKYAEGYPRARYYRGNEFVDAVEELAQERALKVFKLSPKNWHVNVQAYSGSPANLAIYLGLVPLGEKIMGLRLDMGGHLTHGHKVSMTAKAWQSSPYVVDKKTEQFDYKAILKQAQEEKPRIIVAGGTAYPQQMNWKKFREIADAVGAYLLVDMSHIAGLIAGGAYPSPFSARGGQALADVVMTTTHKTLRGPRSALIFARRDSKIAKHYNIDIPKAIDKAVFPGLQGGPHMNQIAAVAVTLFEALDPKFKTYAKQTVKNSEVLAKELAKLGWRIISGGSKSNVVLMDVSVKGLGGEEASVRLEKNNIVTNKNTIPYDPRPPKDPSGVRLGTPSLTTRGMKEKEMKIVAKLITDVLLKNKNVKVDVVRLAKKFPLKYRVNRYI
ncbi:MAG: serine hydroxymethyltransferase [Patescibacteria group bacterium]